MIDEANGLEALRIWGQRLARSPARTQLAEGLRLVVDALGARAAHFVRGGRVDCELGAPFEEHATLLRSASVAFAHSVPNGTTMVDVTDTREGTFGDERPGESLHAAGFTRARAIPVTGVGGLRGVIVVWLGDDYLGPGDRDQTVALVAAFLGTALERDERPESAESTLASLGELTQKASLGNLVEASLSALTAPATALPLQIEESRHLRAELSALVDPNDRIVVELLDHLEHNLTEMTAAASLVQKELLRLSAASENENPRHVFELSRLVQEALAIARPDLEQRGFTIQQRIAKDGRLEGDRHQLLHLFLGLLFSVARDPAIFRLGAPLEVFLQGDDDELSVDVHAASEGPTEPRSFTASPPEQCLRIARAHGGEVSRLPLGFRVRLPTAEAVEGRHPVSVDSPRRILVVDDDPVFSRALRRALRPHDVVLCQTAAETEIALMNRDYLPDLIVCDLFLPGSNGRVLHARIAETRPEAARRFVFVSGAPLSSSDLDYFRAVGRPHLPKPVPLDELFHLLDGERAQAAS